MEQNSPISSQSLIHSSRRTGTLFKVSACLFFVLIVIMVCIGVYQLGFANGRQQTIDRYSHRQSIQQITVKSTLMPSITPTASATLYTLSYSVPIGWHAIVWHPTPSSTSSAIVTPDYTPFNNPENPDPDPQTGLAIFIWRMPKPVNSLQQLRAATEMSEDNMQEITQTVVAGLPTYHAIFVSTDSNRVLDTYHILKGTDHWVISINFSGNSLPALQQEEERFSPAINEFLDSVLFQEYYNST